MGLLRLSRSWLLALLTSNLRGKAVFIVLHQLQCMPKLLIRRFVWLTLRLREEMIRM